MSDLRGEESIAALCRREGIAEGLYYSWSKEFLEAGKKRLAGDTGRQATSGEVPMPGSVPYGQHRRPRAPPPTGPVGGDVFGRLGCGGQGRP